MPKLSILAVVAALLCALVETAGAQEKSWAPLLAPTAKEATAKKEAPAAKVAEPAVAQPVADSNTEPAPPPAAPAQTESPPAPEAESAQPAPPPPPQATLPPEVSDTISSVVDLMDGAEKTLKAITSVDTDLGRLRDEIDGVIARTTKTADGLRPRLSDIQSQIDKLGPPPEKDAPPEAQSAATERARLSSEVSEISGAIKTLEVTWWRARQAIDKITELRLKLFVRSLTERMSSPLFADMWSNLARGLPSVNWRLQYNVEDWVGAVTRQKFSVLLLLGTAIGLYLLLKAIVYRIIRYPAKANGDVPTFFERAASAAWIAPTRIIPGAATALFLYAGFNYLGLLYYPSAAPAGVALLQAALVFIAVAALLTSVFAPREPERRLFQLSNRSARRMSRLLKALAAIYAADLFFTAAGQILYFPLTISVVQALITSLAFAGVLIGLLLTPFEPAGAAGLAPTGRHRPRWIKIPLWLAVATIVIACLLGYVALGRFLAQQILMMGVVGLVAALLLLAIRAFTRGNGAARSTVSAFLEGQMGFDDVRRRQLAWLTESILTVLVAALTLPVVLLQWGVAGADIRDWAKSLLFGFEIGQFRISLVRILIGILLFIALLFVTRIVQRRIRDNVLIQPRMDPGIANSIDTAIGYAGIAVAAIVAISYAGFDITNLAIVAGALSVGIGFGLQSIVNNFVSGLILLIERPIKVGDWVVIGNEQGNVKRISVRSTEIETFDRASLIVPNSELITGRVLNWTHRSALGRVILKFSAGPDADPRRVITVLTECASRHPDILREPPPLAVFEGYTPTTTDFSLRVLLPDINRGLKVKSDLRIAIYEALRPTQHPLAGPPGLTANRADDA